MPTEEEIEIAATAMQNSKAWPVVFKAGSARELARAALVALEKAKPQPERECS